MFSLSGSPGAFMNVTAMFLQHFTCRNDFPCVVISSGIQDLVCNEIMNRCFTLNLFHQHIGLFSLWLIFTYITHNAVLLLADNGLH